MLKRFTILAVIMLFTASLPIAAPLSFVRGPQSKTEKPQTVSFCALADGKHNYPGKNVRVKARWKQGHSFSILFEPGCGVDLVVNFEDEKNLCHKTKEILEKVSREFYSEAEVVVVGKLYRCSTGCGHLGMDRFEFVVICMEEFKPIAGGPRQ